MELANNHFVMSNAIETIFEQVKESLIILTINRKLFFPVD